MPAQSLCAFCAEIPFEVDALSSKPADHIFELGSGLRVLQSQCPFCVLVRDLIFRARKRRLDLNPPQLSQCDEVFVSWYPNGGPGGRGAFGVWAHHFRLEGLWICFACKDDSPLSTESPFYLRQSVEPQLDLGRVSRWLEMCSTQHTGGCSLSDTAPFEGCLPGLRTLRFVDVIDMCLVEKREVCEYVALSYVWGAVPDFRLTTAHLAKLSKGGALSKTEILQHIPQTLRDAMTLVQGLGLRYLWVDALCLVQNRVDEIQSGFAAVMDQIYERSLFTIVAANGHDADAGLVGLLEGSRPGSRPCVEVLRGVRLGVSSDLEIMLQGSAYSQRAWT